MAYAFRRRRGVQGCLFFFVIGIVAWVYIFCWLILPREFWPGAVLFSFIATAFAAALPGIALDTFSPGPILVIGPEGVMYRSFSKTTVPWADIAAVNLNYAITVENHVPRRSTSPGAVSFEVRDPARFPRLWGSLRMPGPVVIIPASVRASPQEIIAAVKANWSGPIRETTPPQIS